MGVTIIHRTQKIISNIASDVPVLDFGTPDVRGVDDGHEDLDEKRKPYEALAGLIVRIVNAAANVCPYVSRRR
jgi:hypothetical protein